MPSYRERNKMAQQSEDLLRDYPDKTAMIEAAIDFLHRWRFPEQYLGEEQPHIIGWDSFTPAQDVVCSDLGILIPAGTLAYREVWSDKRQGAILSRESLIADRAIGGAR